MYTQKELQPDNTKFSIKSYFNYVGLNEFKPSPLSLEDLTTTIKFHLNKFIYDNTELYNAGNLPVSERTFSSLDIDTLFQNMLAQNGGYCFQHLELLYAVLHGVGFKVERYLGKIILQSRNHWDSAAHVNAKTHELLITQVNGKPYIVDVGMCNMSLRAPLELKEGETQIGDDQYRLSKVDSLWALDTKTVGKEWFCLYQFLNVPVTYDEVCNALKSIVFTDQFIPIRDETFYVGLTNENKRKHVIFCKSTGEGFFKSVPANSSKEPKIANLRTLDDAKDFAKAKFGMKEIKNAYAPTGLPKSDIFFSVHKPKLKFLQLHELDLSLNKELSTPNNPQHYNWLKQAAEWAENKWGYMRKFPGLEARIKLIQEKMPCFYLAFYEDQDKNLHLVGTFALTPDELDIEDESKFKKNKKYYVKPLENIQTINLSYLYVHDNFRDFGFGTQIDKAKEIAKKSTRLMTAHLLSSTVHGFYKKRDAVFVEDHRAIDEPCALIHFGGWKP